MRGVGGGGGGGGGGEEGRKHCFDNFCSLALL